MKIAIIGGTGLLGSNLLKLYSDYDVKSFSREQSYNVDKFKNFVIDFRYLEDELVKFFINWKPDIIINTIAIVNLQKCEDNYEEANNINCDIAKVLSKISVNYNSYFIHISTDHYYNDTLQIHNENSEIQLLNNYTKTKYNAEQEVLKYNPKALIVRTNIIGFRRRTAKSFFEWLLDSLKNEDKCSLYTNFYTSPISVQELGKVLIKCYEKNLNGIYNISSKEVISKYDFGMKVAKKFGYDESKIQPTVLENDGNIKRALTLGLDVSKIEKALNIYMPTIDETITNLYKEYMEENNNE
jgi:dTDP-4-dehydrorhamnose reductase